MARKKYYSICSYFSYIATFKWRLLAVMSVFAISSLMLPIIPIAIGQLVATISTKPIDQETLYTAAGLLIGASILHELLWRVADFLYIKLIVGKMHEYENVVFKNVIGQQYPYFIGKFTGKIGSYIGTLGREFQEFIHEACYSYVDQIVRLPAMIAIMFTVNVQTGIIFVVSIMIMIISSRYTMRWAADKEKRLADAASNIDGYTVDAVSNFVSVKAFKKELAELRRITGERTTAIKADKTARYWNALFWGVNGTIVRIVMWPITIILNIYLFMQGAITIEQLTIFLTTILVFSDYVWELIWNASQFNLQLARIEESHRYLFKGRNVVKTQPSDETLVEKGDWKFQESLQLHNLTFAYPEKTDRPVLDTINLTIRKNEKIGIVGKSGSGKTTLTKLLLSYYELTDSSILIDGQPIPNRQLAHIISYVPQDTSLFHRSIRDNIAYGGHGTTKDEDIVLAAKRAHADEFISQLDSGYNTMIGERGIKLSMGQRQRVAIARAFLDNKPLLILDEATSALDSESELLVQRALEDLWHDKTVIAIAHRLSTLRHMDRIVVLGEGKILEEGTHHALLEKKGHYWRLWQHQHEGIIDE